MRLALISDIHGNPIALDAVLHDISARGAVSGYWVLGDLVAQGYDPTGVLERLVKLPNARFVRGNTDRYTLSGGKQVLLAMLLGRHATRDEIAAPIPPVLVPGYVITAQGRAWNHGALAATGWLDWLASIPLEQRLTLPDGTRVLGIHASPGCDDGVGMEPYHSDDDLMARFSGGDADLIFVGHCHSPQERHIGPMHLVEVGSVSNPRGDRRASYALLEADTSGYHVTLHRVAYDTEAVINAITQHHFFPNPDWLIEKFIARA